MSRLIGATALALLIVAACAQDLSIHVRGGDRPPNPEYLVNGGVDVQRLQIVLRRLRMQAYPTDGGVDVMDGTLVIGDGPYLVDVPMASLENGVFTEVVSGVHTGPKGFYEMDINLSPVTAAEATATPALAPLVGKTFVISGLDAQGKPFIFSSSVQATLVRDYTFRMGMNHNNLDINIEPNTWFATDAGTFDPSNPAHQAAIEQNVLHSIDAYQDDDMDGHPDPLG